MTPEDKILLDIENEIKLKRLDPEVLVKQLEENLDEINKRFETSFSLAFDYRRKYKEWQKKIAEPAQQMDAINKKLERVIELHGEIERRLKSGKDFSAQDKEMTELTNDVNNSKVDFSSWSAEGLKELDYLVLERERILSKGKISSNALIGLLNSGYLGFIFNVLVFSLSFAFSFFAGDKLEQNITQLGPFFSKLIPALVLFLTLDKVTKKLEALLIWERVKYLNRKLKECVSNISQQTFLLNEIEKRMIKKTP